jgi:hypothetical protein
VKLSIGGLKILCQTNIVELKFVRRTKVLPQTRRMLATLDRKILDSELGRQILKFKPPIKFPSYNAEAKGLLTVWDLFFQDWRNIPVDACEVVSTVPSQPVEKFWEYFDKVLSKMSAQQKAIFMSK